MAEALISVLLERLASVTYHHIEDEVRLVLDAKKEVEEFAAHLEDIRAVLEDAEQRQVKEASVRNWLDKLEDIAYKMDDVLDEWNTEILKQQVEKKEANGENAHVANKKTVCFSIPSYCFCFGPVSRVIRHRDIAVKIKNLNESLVVIAKQRQTYNFQYLERSIELPEREKTSSFVDTSAVFGREKQKGILVSKLFSQSSEEGNGLLVIPIVGMGGMGKTTLSQLAYNDENVKSYFEKRIWVCVSEPFDEIKIAKAIINGAKGTTPESDELEDFLQCMAESIAAKKLLLVLDDVWTQDQRKWEKLETPLIQSCAKGSRILVTTRKQEIAIMMGATTHMIHMEVLSEQDCLSIFKHTAFSGRENFESNELESIGKEIAKKCKGLPLAAKTTGSLMRYKETRREWQDVLDSEIWDLQEVEQQVFQPLLLSYYDLAPAIRRCLLYCAIFPKDYEFNKDRLVELWMSQDLLNLKGNKEKKVIGQRFFGNLVMRSFFQDLVKDEDGNIIGCKMHDIVRDFVQFLTKNDCVCMEAIGTNIETELLRANYTIGLGDSKIRHLTLMFAPKGPFLSSISSCNFKNLRSLSALDSKITTIHSNLLLELKCLRTLNLSHNLIKEVPEEIVELVHLRYIDFSFNRFLRKLPNTVCDLCNLQTLRFVGCYGLQNLPQSMGKLINLSHLYVSGCDKLKYLPKGIMGLQSLRTLDEFRVSGSDNNEALKLGDLGTLDQLQGVLRIRIPGNGEDGEAEKAQLWNKKQLSHLKLIFENFQNEERKTSSVEIVLNVLRPQQDLEYLDIRCYHGKSGPNWMMSLHNLRILILRGWNECQFLPPLGKLPSLERLMISDMRKVKKVGDEFLGIENQTSIKSSSSASILFPKLKQLRLGSMSGLQEWEGVGGVEEEDSDKITIMPCLSSLNITLCSGLKTLPGFLLKSPLQNLFFRHCRNLGQSYRPGTGKEWPKISHIPNITIDETDPDFDDEEGHEIVQEKDVL